MRIYVHMYWLGRLNLVVGIGFNAFIRIMYIANIINNVLCAHMRSSAVDTSSAISHSTI